MKDKTVSYHIALDATGRVATLTLPVPLRIMDRQRVAQWLDLLDDLPGSPTYGWTIPLLEEAQDNG